MDRIEALAEAWATYDGRADKFQACKADPARERVEGRYGGYRHEAERLLQMLERRGFTIVPLDPPTT